MIRSLRIDNFALIDRVELHFEHGFTVITGETGSGKSILLNALHLILGDRADFSVIGNRKDKSIVEAEIDISNFAMNNFFDQNELDYFDMAIVRREINKQGRSRAFINDIPVSLNVLKEFTSQIIHIHSQYNTLELKNRNYQLQILDVLAGSMELRMQFHSKYNDWKRLTAELELKKREFGELIAGKDYNEFQLNELLELQLDKLDYEDIRERFKRAESTEDIKLLLSELFSVLNSEKGVLDLLTGIKRNFSRKSGIDSKLDEITDRLEASVIELQDLEQEAQDIFDSLEISAEEFSELSKLTDKYYHVLNKHQLDSQQELIDLKNSLSASSESTEELENEISDLEKLLDERGRELGMLADELSERRRFSLEQIEFKITAELDQLKLKDTSVKFVLLHTDQFEPYGKDRVEILFSPNPGIDPVPIHKAASGGELSRVMLAIQHLMSTGIQLKTILFDEIDTGVSGDVAQRIGVTLKSMGTEMQVIAITHLPQVAAKGEEHFKVLKFTEEGNTKTVVKKLDHNERVEEIARLMSGDVINEAAMENAKALMA